MRYSFIAVALLLFVACKKKETTNQPPPTPPPPPVVPVAAKKFLVDSSISKFTSTPQDIANGDFKYDVLPGVDSLKKGDFFIEPRDYGYLRKIETVTKSTGLVTVATTQGDLSEFYKDSGLVKRTYSIPDASNPFARKSGLNARALATLPTINVAGDGWSLSLENVNFTFNPNWVYELDVSNKYLKIGFDKALTTFGYDVSVSADFTGSASKEFKLSSIYPAVSKLIKVPIPGLFAQVDVVDFIVKVKLEGGGKVGYSFHYKKQTETTAYIEYKNSALNRMFSLTSPIYENEKKMNIPGGLTATIEIYPIFGVREFGIPIVNLGVKGIFETELKHSFIHDTWNLESKTYGAFFANFKKTAFQFVAPEEVSVLTPSFKLLETPKTIKHLSGGNELVEISKPLKAPIVLQVFEANYFKPTNPEPEALVNVFFSSNYGKWENAKIRTGIDGKVSNKFTMGPEEKEHILTATIKNADNVIIDSYVLKITPTKIDTLAMLRAKTWILSNANIEAVDGFSCNGNPTVYHSILQSAVLNFASSNGQTTYTSSFNGLARTYTGTTPCMKEANTTISHSGIVDVNLPGLFFNSSTTTLGFRPFWNSTIVSLTETKLVLASDWYRGSIEFNAQ